MSPVAKPTRSGEAKAWIAPWAVAALGASMAATGLAAEAIVVDGFHGNLVGLSVGRESVYLVGNSPSNRVRSPGFARKNPRDSGADWDFFVAEVPRDGGREPRVLYGGGSDDDEIIDSVFIGDHHLAICGESRSFDLDPQNDFRSEGGGLRDGFAMVIDLREMEVISSLGIGGAFPDGLTSVSTTPHGTLLLAGYALEDPWLHDATEIRGPRAEGFAIEVTDDLSRISHGMYLRGAMGASAWSRTIHVHAVAGDDGRVVVAMDDGSGPEDEAGPSGDAFGADAWVGGVDLKEGTWAWRRSLRRSGVSVVKDVALVGNESVVVLGQGVLAPGSMSSATVFAACWPIAGGDAKWTLGWGAEGLAGASQIRPGNDGVSWIGGYCSRPEDVPSSRDAASRSCAGGLDGYLMGVDADGGVVYGTLMGGAADDVVSAVASWSGGWACALLSRSEPVGARRVRLPGTIAPSFGFHVRIVIVDR